MQCLILHITHRVTFDRVWRFRAKIVLKIKILYETMIYLNKLIKGIVRLKKNIIALRQVFQNQKFRFMAV